MPELHSWRWAQYAPNIPGNRDLERPFYLRIKADLPQARLVEFFERLGAKDNGWRAAFEGLVEMGDEPLTLDGKPVATLAEYIEAVATTEYLPELVHAIRWHNSVEGAHRSFSERLSGSDAITLFGTGKAQTAATPSPSGSGTRA